LSGGQKQAIGLARVLIRRPKILFLDEPTAHFDVRSESEFLERLKVLADGKMTIIVSTHRLSLLSLVDRLLLFDKGRLVADGPRDKVIALLQGNANKPSPAASPGAASQGTPSPGAAPSSAATVVATISSSAASATAAARTPTGIKSSVAI